MTTHITRTVFFRAEETYDEFKIWKQAGNEGLPMVVETSWLYVDFNELGQHFLPKDWFMLVNRASKFRPTNIDYEMGDWRFWSHCRHVTGSHSANPYSGGTIQWCVREQGVIPYAMWGEYMKCSGTTATYLASSLHTDPNRVLKPMRYAYPTREDRSDGFTQFPLFLPSHGTVHEGGAETRISVSRPVETKFCNLMTHDRSLLQGYGLDIFDEGFSADKTGELNETLKSRYSGGHVVTPLPTFMVKGQYVQNSKVGKDPLLDPATQKLRNTDGPIQTNTGPVSLDAENKVKLNERTVADPSFFPIVGMFGKKTADEEGFTLPAPYFGRDGMIDWTNIPRADGRNKLFQPMPYGGSDTLRQIFPVKYGKAFPAVLFRLRPELVNDSEFLNLTATATVRISVTFEYESLDTLSVVPWKRYEPKTVRYDPSRGSWVGDNTIDPGSRDFSGPSTIIW